MLTAGMDVLLSIVVFIGFFALHGLWRALTLAEDLSKRQRPDQHQNLIPLVDALCCERPKSTYLRMISKSIHRWDNAVRETSQSALPRKPTDFRRSAAASRDVARTPRSAKNVAGRRK